MVTNSVLAGVIGHPIGHSLSPELFRILSRNSNLDLQYRKLNVAPRELSRFVKVLKNIPLFSGWNVTIPHKEKMVKLIDEADVCVSQIHALNVVQFRDGKLKGYNTDVIGFARTLEFHKANLHRKDVTVFGAGGAAMAVGYVLGRKKARSVEIVNRNPVRARQMALRLCRLFPLTEFKYSKRASTSSHLYVNATPLGMQGFPPSPVLPKMKKDAICIDLIYRPAETGFISQARQQGVRAVNGSQMLVEQAIATWEIWFGPLKQKNEKRRKIMKLLNSLGELE